MGLPSLALTETEKYNLIINLENVCKSYKDFCTVVITNDINIQAYTTPYGKIVITSGLLDKVTYNEALSVGYHEVGHRVLNHFGKFMDYYYNNYPLTAKEFQEFKHKQEIEADTFSALLDLKLNGHSYLASALSKISPQKYNVMSTKTHPATNARIRHLKEITK